MDPLSGLFIRLLFTWAFATSNPLDLVDRVRGPKDSGIPTSAAIGDVPAPAAAGPETGDGMRVGVFLPQSLPKDADVSGLRPYFTFDFTERWPITFGHHNARLTAQGGNAATLDEWVVYSMEGTYHARVAGAHSFVLTFQSPAPAMSCFAYLVIGGVEVFPDFERKVRKAVPPRIVLAERERRTFVRTVNLTANQYPVRLTTACHPGRKPEPRLGTGLMASWEATTLAMTVQAPGDATPRAFQAAEMTLPTP